MPNTSSARQPFKAILGMGLTGLSCARFLARQQMPFVVMDSREAPPNVATFKKEFPDVPVSLGGWQETWLADAEEIVVSPGVDLHATGLAKYQGEHAKIIGDIELFARHASAPIVAITGSNGKSTVTTLVADMARCAGWDVRMGGNIGIPALDLLQSQEPDLYVLELSSFQLDVTHSLAPAAAVVLNISPDHLDRHGSLMEYIAAKQRIYQHCRHAVVNVDDPALNQFEAPQITSFTLNAPAAEQFGVLNEKGEHFLVYGSERWCDVKEIRLAGCHNWGNALAALALGRAVGLPKPAMLQALNTFSGLPHRCQKIGEYEGVAWYNDSKGTNVGATQAAIAGLAAGGARARKSIILIAGGVGKGADFTDLKAPVAQHVREVIVLGEAAQTLQATLHHAADIVAVSDIDQAVNRAKQLAQPGDQVLLSPACASFDMFKDYTERGEMFSHAVKNAYAVN